MDSWLLLQNYDNYEHVQAEFSDRSVGLKKFPHIFTSSEASWQSLDLGLGIEPVAMDPGLKINSNLLYK